MLLKYGPMKIKPGQNLISVDLLKERPNVDGWIVGFRPGMIRVLDKKSPAGGRDPPAPRGLARRLRTDVRLRRGEDLHQRPARLRLALHDAPELDPQPHDPQPHADAGEGLPDDGDRLHPRHGAGGGGHHGGQDALDGRPGPHAVSGLQRRPQLGQGGQGYVYPDDDPKAYKRAPRIRNRWVVDHDATLVGTIGHVHPGGLCTDLWLKRGGRRRNLFRSNAHYFEPAGPDLVGPGDGRHAAGVEGRRQEGRRALDHGDLRDASAAPGTSRWGSCPSRSRRGPPAASTRSAGRSTSARCSATGACRRTSTPAASRTRALEPAARCATGRYVDRS